MVELSRKGTYRKYEVNKNSFLAEDDVSFYLLGAYMTDGNINSTKHHLNCSISSKDDDWLESIRDTICPTKPVYYKSFSFDFSDIDCQNWLISYGCTPKKSLTLRIEKEIPLEYQRDFLRGVIDGDGSISTSYYTKKLKSGEIKTYMKKSLYICSASYAFIDKLKDFVPNGINYSIINIKQKESTINGKPVKPSGAPFYRIAFSDSNALKLAKYVYYDDHKLSLRRKHNIAKYWFSL